MVTSRDDSLVYRRRLSQPLSELLSDPFSDLTRKRQTALLIAASVALLVSMGLATIGDVEASFLKLNWAAAQHTKWVVFAVTCYLLVAYLLSVSADLATVRIKGWSPLASINDVEAAMISDQEVRIKANQVWIDKAHEALSQRSKIIAEWRAKVDPASLPRSEVAESLTIIELAEKCGIDVSEPFLKRIAPFDCEITDAAKHLSPEPWLDMRKEKQQLTDALGRFSVIKRLRFVLEAFFPMAYSLFALVWTVWHK